MHDEQLERRLRSALREEADGLSFTITTAEMERRMAVRGRRMAGGRLTLLLAATVAIGVVGAGAVIAGLSNKPAPSPVAVATAAPSPAGTVAPPTLPSLDALMASDPLRILVAQAYGPADSPGQPISDAVAMPIPIVSLGTLQAGGDYQVSVACLGRIPLEVALLAVGSGDSIDGPSFACDGTVRDETIHVDGSVTAWVWYRGTTSWRVVVRGDRRQLPLPTTNPVLPTLPEGIDELIRLDDAMTESVGDPWASSGLQLREIGAVPARAIYAAQVWCEPGATIRLLFADRIARVLTPNIETAITCDGLVHDIGLPLPLPNGSPVLVAAAPSTRWSVLVASATPPVSLADAVPGWQQAGGIGPSLQFSDTEMSFSDTVGDAGGPLMVVLECAGESQDIKVEVDATGILGDAFQAHAATCVPDGARTTFTFDTGPTGYIVQHEAPAGTWTALSLLIPTASPGP